MSINRVHKELGWPSPNEVWAPAGPGPRVYAALADRKIGTALRRLEGRNDIRLGVLTPDSADSSSQQPFAIVCDFQAVATVGALREAHRLAWNFSRAPLLITLEPHLIRAWTCCEPPSSEPSLHAPAAEIPEARWDLTRDGPVAAQAARSLHWLELVTGNFFRRHEARFNRDGCADRLLLDNLKHVRQLLFRQQLSDDTSHDLLARLIFIQFLFDRKDSFGTAALNATKLRGLHREGILKAPHDTLSSVLDNYEDTYSLFRWLDNIFNGDLFPGKSDTQKHRAAEWEREMDEVESRHLKTIADFVSGRVAMKSKQSLLWKQYSFDAIPLEFISSIYEEFVTKIRKKKSGAVYTPPHAVDFVLDEVLPWDSREWNVRVLDPACGSGIFLVKALQRLVHRWRLAHPGSEPKPADLRLLLERNLFGVDIDPHAVRVASFSLYLAMCDEIDPKHYWTQVHFPRLRDKNLVCSDFFAEDGPGFRTTQDAATFDVVVGNAPWGQDTVGDSDISQWEEAGWSAAFNSIGPIFLAKASALLKAGGRLSMLQPAGLLLNNVGTAKAFRQKLFSTLAIETIVNLAALRFTLFPNAVGPACIITLRNEPAIDRELVYICPKPTVAMENEYRIVVDPYDVHIVGRCDVDGDAIWWTALMWGGRRDVELIRALKRQVTLKSAAPRLTSRKGIVRSTTKRRKVRQLIGRRVLESPRFPPETWLRLKARDLPLNKDSFIDASTAVDFVAFDLPQMVIKKSWTTQSQRFQAAMIDSDARTGGVLCTQSYITIHVPSGQERVLEAVCLTCNSILAVYFLFLTSSRLASYRPEPLVSDWLDIPIPRPSVGLLDGLKTHADIDRRVFERLELTATDRALIEDTVRVTLADFKGDESSPGRRTTRSPKSRSEPVLTKYCEQFVKVLQAAFGPDKQVRATVFQEKMGEELPVRLVALHLNWPGEGGIVTEIVEGGFLCDRLRAIGDGLSANEARGGFQRMARVYDSITVKGQVVPTVYLIKPDSVRYWTRAVAIRDADEVYADFLLSAASRPTTSEREVRLA